MTIPIIRYELVQQISTAMAFSIELRLDVSAGLRLVVSSRL